MIALFTPGNYSFACEVPKFVIFSLWKIHSLELKITQYTGKSVINLLYPEKSVQYLLKKN